MRDLISRQAMLDAIKDIDNEINMDIYTNEVRDIVNEIPSAIHIIAIIVDKKNIDIVTNKGKIRFLDRKMLTLADVEIAWNKENKEK